MSAAASTYKAKKATFTVTTTKQGRVFSAVNKRAHAVARKAGKRTKVTVAELKALKGTGTYKFYQYTDTGALVPVRF